MTRFNKPSKWRWFWSTVAAAAVVYGATVIIVYALALSPVGDFEAQSPSRYIGLLMWVLIFAAPVYMALLWFVSLPVIVALGAWWAWTHTSANDLDAHEP